MCTTEIIVTTYNNPQALNYTLLALTKQSLPVNYICIADDGSGPETEAVIQSFQKQHPSISTRHLWQEDDGFRKNELLNKAIASSEADLLIFIDGDCLAAPEFVARHVELAQPGQFCSGSVIRLTEANTQLVDEALITSGELFGFDWLNAHGQIDRIGTRLKTNRLGNRVGGVLESISPVKIVWNGGNSSGWRKDILAVNGFDENLRYGAEDVEMGQRLKNNGVVGRHIRYTAPLLHLEHPRGYADMELLKRNKAYVKEVKAKGITWTEDGIVKGPRPAC